nr:MAG TPA: Baseplate component [Caudoviricetes sp.]
MRLYYQIEVDLYKPYPLPVMEAQQNNIGRGAVVTLKANGAIIQPTNEGLTFWAKKPDGTVSFLAATLTGNNIQMDFTNQMLALPGMVQVEIRLTSGSGEAETDISTPIFAVKVNPSNINDSGVESQNEFTALQVAIGEVQSALAEVDELKKNGLKGDPGQAATVEVGTVTASEPGGSPSVTNAGTEQAAVLDFVLPRGEQGPKGADGAAGKDGKEQIVFAAASSFPTTGDPAMLYVDNTVSPAIIYTWDGSSYVQASADIGMVMAMLATPFSAAESYSAGKYVTYNGQYWRFTADKTAGAWDASKAEATNIGAELSALNTKILPVTFLDIMTNTYAHLYQSGKHFSGLLFAVNDTPKNKIPVKADSILGIGNASSGTYYSVPVASVFGNPFGLTANQYTCVGMSLDRATDSSGTLSIVPGFALALYNGTDTLLYCSVGGGSTTYNSTRYLTWIDYFIA